MQLSPGAEQVVAKLEGKRRVSMVTDPQILFEVTLPQALISKTRGENQHQGSRQHIRYKTFILDFTSLHPGHRLTLTS